MALINHAWLKLILSNRERHWDKIVHLPSQRIRVQRDEPEKNKKTEITAAKREAIDTRVVVVIRWQG